MKKLLIIDDSPEICKQLKWGLGKEYQVLLAQDVEEALTLFTRHKPKVLTLDLGLPPDVDGATEGLRCLEQILREQPDTKVIVLSGNENRDNALQAVQLGAYDFYRKPIDLAELKVILQRAFHLSTLEEENRRLQTAALTDRDKGWGMLGQCPQMEEVFTTIRKVAPADIPILILGENGTGKELVAKAIHSHSLRNKGELIPINCGAIPENLLEAELFGHEKGAFTGAAAQVKGKVEYAHGGTLFLDEIGELPLPLQVKILRFLQEKTIERVGGRKEIDVDARIVAATNVDIEEAIKQGNFREDLYYRIGVITIKLPPLRERGEDISLLANYFLNRYVAEFSKKIKGYSAAAEAALTAHPWPGNVREMENRIKRAILLADGPVIEPCDLGFEVKTAPEQTFSTHGLTLKEARDRIEREMLVAALKKNAGNVARSSEELGVSRPTFYDLMKKHHLHQA
ncbi:PEP-CTERM-box response regulator transcription factor [Syntrophotalea acetylenica]|uniref:PEP-CTERM-box response regulator transcription factor n=1 Tax=Syntrophotalea acetylenica TaxID=29542 RepID=UPI002A372119|nr:PEP-CTERM-box response regulator transcription factor [Syntrophotalea acetylenica]MDY0263353.1 PEP-CTERM-box response regulator transcription factor [Syntrophotalea acetylenica]